MKLYGMRLVIFLKGDEFLSTLLLFLLMFNVVLVEGGTTYLYHVIPPTGMTDINTAFLFCFMTFVHLQNYWSTPFQNAL